MAPSVIGGRSWTPFRLAHVLARQQLVDRPFAERTATSADERSSAMPAAMTVACSAAKVTGSAPMGAR